MEIQHKSNKDRGSLFAESDGKKTAELVYSINNNVMTIEHTEVDASLRGKNIGLKMVTKAATFARENNLKIFPQCSFAAAIFNRKKEEYEDILLNNEI